MKIELLITFDREMISARTFHQLLLINRGNYKRQHFEWWHIHYDAPKSKSLLKYLARRSVSEFDFRKNLGVNHMKTLSESEKKNKKSCFCQVL